MYQTIISAIDGSEQSIEAAKEAIELGAENDSTVHFLFVIEKHPTFTKVGLSGLGDPAKSDEYREYASEKLAEVESLAAERGVDTSGTTQEGAPHEKIIDYATDQNADLIVLGARGEGSESIQERILGSTTERVARGAPMSVLVAR